MKIRKGTPQDMPDVLALINELAVFEKEPDAVVISTEDLVRDGFSENPLFHTFVAEVKGPSITSFLMFYCYLIYLKTNHFTNITKHIVICFYT